MIKKGLIGTMVGILFLGIFAVATVSTAQEATQEKPKIELCLLKDETIRVIDKFIDDMEKIVEKNIGPIPQERKERARIQTRKSILKDLSQSYRIVEQESDCPTDMTIYHPEAISQD